MSSTATPQFIPLDFAALGTIVGPEHVLPWNQMASPQQDRFAQAIAPGTPLDGVVLPETQEQLASVVGHAHQHQLSILPYGNGSKLHWGGLVQKATLAVGTARLNRLIEHAVGDLTVTAEVGMKFAELQQRLATAHQFLALDPAYPDQATLGGIVATGDTGSLRQRYRGVRDMILGITFVRADGQITKAGGRVVKNVAGYDLMKLLTGSYGTLGIISQVTFRVYPLPETSGTVVLTGAPESIAQATQTLLGSALTPVAVDLLSSQIVQQLQLGTGLGLIVRFQGLVESVRQQSDRVLDVGEKLGLNRNLPEQEAELWQQLPQQIWQPGNSQPIISQSIICKIGVLPTAAVSTLVQAQTPGWIHAGVGLGILQFDPDIPLATLLELRRWCQAKGGFLSILQAPIEVKQQLDVWGYGGNALDLMRHMKQQFDPQNLLSPQRFVGKI
ncbi:MAG: FAD-binding oxidoreductase [Microcoleaceae cyanobacterium]